MKTIKTKVYLFNELSEDAKIKAIEDAQNAQINTDYDWHQFIVEDFKEKMYKQYGIDVSNVYFNGFYSQGDGACFEGNVNIYEYLKQTKQLTRYKSILKYVKEYLPNINIKQSGHYYHSKSMTFTDNYFFEASETIQNVLYEIMDEIIEICEEESDTLYRELEDEYQRIVSDEAIADTLIANEYYFTEDGTMYL